MGRLPNIHAGEVLLEEFLKPLKLSQNRMRNLVVSIHGQSTQPGEWPANRLARHDFICCSF